MSQQQGNDLQPSDSTPGVGYSKASSLTPQEYKAKIEAIQIKWLRAAYARGQLSGVDGKKPMIRDLEVELRDATSALTIQLLREVRGKMPEKPYRLEGSGGTGGIETKTWKVYEQPASSIINQVVSVLDQTIEQLGASEVTQ